MEYTSDGDASRSIQPATTLGSIVTDTPDLAAVFDRLGLDYCCNGQRTLADACASAGLDVEATIEALVSWRLAAALDETTDAASWAGLDPSALADHIEATHHAYLRAELPRLSELAERVAGVHGGSHPELVEVRRVYEELRADLAPHLLREEDILFPLIREIDRASASGRRPNGSSDNAIAVLNDDHHEVGALLAQLRRLTGSFTVPDDGCASYRSLYAGLDALVADTHLHVHKENNVLFPAVVARERALHS